MICPFFFLAAGTKPSHLMGYVAHLFKLYIAPQFKQTRSSIDSFIHTKVEQKIIKRRVAPIG